MATFSDLIASLDTDPTKRGKQFEVFVRWFLKNDPEWVTQVSDIWLWEDYPDRWGVDCGIDLVFKHKNGETWAVQAKCYSTEYDITKHDVDKFLSESNRKGIDKRLLIATTDGIGANAKQVCEAQEKKVVRFLLSNFESADLEYPASFDEMHKAKRKDPPTPKDHQVEAITAVAENFQGTDRGQLIMACGTGKTFTTLWIKEALSANSTLVLLPSLGLLSQTLHEWTLAANQPFDVLCVCSDETVVKRGGDEAIHSVADLAFPVTSDVAEIKQFLKRDRAKVVFSTYQSSPLIAEAQAEGHIPYFDLAIADEAHRCAGKVSGDFSTVLDQNRIRATKRLFTTATPRTYSTNVKKVAEDRGVEVVGMDDEAVFGKVLYSLPFGQAIKRGLLTDYRVVIIGVDNPTIAEWIANRELLKTDSGIENDAESLAGQIGLLKAFKDYDLKRVISFHSRVSRAEAFTQDIQQVVGWVGDEHKPTGTLMSDFVSGAMPTDKRRRKLSQLKSLGKNERGLLSNARCLSEGVDVPSLDGVAFIDPRSSQIDIIQAVGRAIRLSPDKKAGTIVLPVFIEDGDSPIESIEASNFKPIWEVLNALKAHDDVLSSELDQVRTEMGRKSGSKVDSDAFSKITIDLPSSVDGSFGDSLRTFLAERVTDSWNYWFGMLETYVETTNDASIPTKHITLDGFKLGSWVSEQRKRKSRNLLTQIRVQRLGSLPGWSWDPVGELWEQTFRELKSYVDQYGSVNVSRKYRTPSGFALDSWIVSQRLNRSKDILTTDQIARLESLPGWSWDPFGELWDRIFTELRSYLDQYGSVNVPRKYRTPSGFALDSWIVSQRRKKTDQMLSQEYIKRLEQLPAWSWDPIDEKWEMGFSELTSYVDQHGTATVTRRFLSESNFKLGSWIGRQRRRYSENRLTPDQIQRLQTLPEWSWDPFSEKWETAFSLLCSYVTAHGNVEVPRDVLVSKGLPLAAWVSKQRMYKTKNLLSQNHIQRLEELSGWSWDPISEQWETMFEQLQLYGHKCGDANVSRRHVTTDGLRLGNWVSTQRKNRFNNILTQDRVERLEALQGWSWDVLSDQWEEAFECLAAFLALHGNLQITNKYVAPDGFKLGSWVSDQRKRKSRNLLSQDRIERLEALPGWLWSTKQAT